MLNKQFQWVTVCDQECQDSSGGILSRHYTVMHQHFYHCNVRKSSIRETWSEILNRNHNFSNYRKLANNFCKTLWVQVCLCYPKNQFENYFGVTVHCFLHITTVCVEKHRISVRNWVLFKGIVHLKMKIAEKCTHP